MTLWIIFTQCVQLYAPILISDDVMNLTKDMTNTDLDRVILAFCKYLIQLLKGVKF